MCLAFVLASCSHSNSDRVQGYIEGEFLYIASPFGGSVTTLSVQKGAQVKQGEPLFALDDTPEKAARDEADRRLAQARANLEDANKSKRPTELDSLKSQIDEARSALALAEKDLEREQKLNDSGVNTASELDHARSLRDQDLNRVNSLESDLKTAQLGARSDQIRAAAEEVRAREAALAGAEWNLAQKRQSAPRDAFVFDTLYRQGEWVAAGRPVVVLLPPQNIKLRCFVEEQRVGSIHAGDRVNVSVDGADHPVSGKISYISPQAEYTPPVIYSKENRAKLMFMIEAVFEPGDASQLHPGQPVDVQFKP